MDVYSALASTKAHPTAEELHRLVAHTSPGLSLATIYNTLEALCAAGLARRVPTSGNASARYDADTSNHLHLVRENGEVLDLPEDFAREILGSLPADLSGRLAARFGPGVSHLSVQLDSSRGPVR